MRVRPQRHATRVDDLSLLVSYVHWNRHCVQRRVSQCDTCDELCVIERQNKVTLELIDRGHYSLLRLPSSDVLSEYRENTYGIAVGLRKQRPAGGQVRVPSGGLKRECCRRVE